MFYKVKMPFLIKAITPSLIYSIDNNQKSVYLTFDDGPNPEVTPLVLDILASNDAKATFFCLGENVNDNPVLFERIKREGHSVGNHSYNHLDGWNTKNEPYYKDIEQSNKLIKSNLFRPPYGRITPPQIKYLKKKYKIVMWDILSSDFDTNNTSEQCINNVLSNVKPGSIIVFHDNTKAKETLLKSLPNILERLKSQDYNISPIKK